jgi:hypothetical protein
MYLRVYLDFFSTFASSVLGIYHFTIPSPSPSHFFLLWFCISLFHSLLLSCSLLLSLSLFLLSFTHSLDAISLRFSLNSLHSDFTFSSIIRQASHTHPYILFFFFFFFFLKHTHSPSHLHTHTILRLRTRIHRYARISTHIQARARAYAYALIYTHFHARARALPLSIYISLSLSFSLPLSIYYTNHLNPTTTTNTDIPTTNMDTQTPLSGVDNNINLDSNIESSNITNMEPEVTATSSTLPAATKLPTDSATTIEERREATAQRILLQIQELNAEHRVKLDDLLLQLQGLDGFSATGDEAATGDEDVVSNSWDIMEPAQVLRLVRQDFDEIVIKLAITTVGAKDIDGIIAFLDKLPFKDLPSNTVTKMSDGQILINCTACEEQTRSEYMILTSCGHCYCAYCLSTLFTIAATNEALFPPSCCDKVLIPLAHVRPLLTHDAYDAFVHKKVELETPFSDRTYCSNSQCGKFVADGSAAAGFGAQTATCWSCWQMTCHRCKKNGSWGHECDGIVDDEADVALLEYAEKMHWQRCWNCYRVVEKQDGCHHMEYVFFFFPFSLLLWKS